MPARHGRESAPQTFVKQSRKAESWAEAELKLGAPFAAFYAQGLARNLREAMAGRSAREVSRLAGLSDATVGAVLAGENWPDLLTIAKLEVALEADLWPGRAVLP